MNDPNNNKTNIIPICDPGLAVVEDPAATFVPLPDTPITDGFVVVPPTVQVTAPSDMPEGYQFSVDDYNGRHLVVAVPEGGVQQGVTFQALVVQDRTNLSNQSHKIPVGQWRDGTFDCCQLGACHPQLCLTLWLTPLALGQILTRLGLDWCANPLTPETKQAAWSAFKALFIIFVSYQASDTLLYYLTDEYVHPQYDASAGRWIYPQADDIPTWVNILDAIRRSLSIAYGLIMLFITIRARSYIRAKYAIPEQTCTGCEDFCCGFFCGPCTICQMARHTADYATYQATCCSDTGLDPRDPPVV